MNSGHTYKCKCLDEYTGKNCEHSKYFPVTHPQCKWSINEFPCLNFAVTTQYKLGNIMYFIWLSVFSCLSTSGDIVMETTFVSKAKESKNASQTIQ